MQFLQPLTTVMVPKTLKDSRGVTIIELAVVSIILAVLITAILLIVNPVEIQAKGRDEKRLTDLSVLDRAINEYNLDNSTYPDLVDTTRKSTVLPVGNSGPLQNPADGWIDVNMSLYLTRLPTDPTNDETYYYSYRHTTFTYELNVVLEHYSEFAVNTYDGGNNASVYEIGNDLTIL